jgi:hypothetical protein
MAVPIPDEWKRDVCAVLRNGKNILVRITSAQRRWCDAFPGATRYDLFDALIEALKPAVVLGKQITDMREPGETYEFKFFPDEREFYGKICLNPDRKGIIIYSAHISPRGWTL